MIRGSEAAIARLYTALLANALDFATTKVTVHIDVEGLGLAIVAEIARRHHGRVHIPQKGHGAVVVRLLLSGTG